MQRDSSFQLTGLQFGPRIFGGLDGTSRDIGPENFNQGRRLQARVFLDPRVQPAINLEALERYLLGRKAGREPGRASDLRLGRYRGATVQLVGEVWILAAIVATNLRTTLSQVLIFNNTAWLIASSTMMTIH